ncbi:MAG: ferredoxin [Bdellovibrio sp.]|nr:ferredoxin [Bdellovibrio sp.]
MADKHNRWPENMPGRFYVDEQCIACEACLLEAPRFFTINKVLGYAYVFKQPKTPQEIDECLRACNICPVLAIGSDGE